MSDSSHPLSERGLGSPPFDLQYVKHKAKEAECAACRAKIKHDFQVRSSEGKRFSLGSECVHLIGDKEAIQKAEAQRKQLADEEDDQLLQSFCAYVRSEAGGNALKHRSHPHKFHADQGKTYLDYCEYVLENAGRKKMLSVARDIAGDFKSGN